MFFFDVLDPAASTEICAKECPREMLSTKEDVQAFAISTGSRLCRYDIEPDDYLDPDLVWSKNGTCPELPVFAR